ncbi:hypothetical protein J7L48_01235 [bacterium]|nr:hypothetical protein [bacterium]
MSTKTLYSSFLGREKEIFDILKSFYPLSGHFSNLTERKNFIKTHLKNGFKEDEMGNILYEVGKGNINILVPIGIDDGYLGTMNKEFRIFKKNLYGTGVVDNFRIALALLLILILKNDLNDIKLSFLFYAGQHSNYEGLIYFLENHNFNLALTFEQGSVNRLGIIPVNYDFIRIYLQDEDQSPYFKLGAFLSAIKKENTLNRRIIIKKIFSLSHNNYEPKMGYIDLLIKTGSNVKENLKFIEKFVKKGFFYNKIHSYSSKRSPQDTYIKELFNDSILALSKEHSISLLPLSTSLSFISAILRNSGTHSFDLGLFTYSYGSVDREEIILPTINMGIKNILNIISGIGLLGEKTDEFRKSKEIV